MIKPANRTPLRPTSTDADGNPCYWFTLANGSDVTLAFEWSAVTGGPTATPQPPATATPQPGGATFTANVFNDANGNGARDSGEAALSGWRVTAFDQANNDAVARTGTTDANGNVTLSGLASGSYRICEDLQSGWSNTRPTAKDGAGRPCYWFSIQNGQTQNVAFGNRNTGTPATATPVATATPNPNTSVRFNIVKFSDFNANGQRDGNELPFDRLGLSDHQQHIGGQTPLRTDANGTANALVARAITKSASYAVGAGPIPGPMSQMMLCGRVTG